MKVYGPFIEKRFESVKPFLRKLFDNPLIYQGRGTVYSILENTE